MFMLVYNGVKITLWVSNLGSKYKKNVPVISEVNSYGLEGNISVSHVIYNFFYMFV